MYNVKFFNSIKNCDCKIFFFYLWFIECESPRLNILNSGDVVVNWEKFSKWQFFLIWESFSLNVEWWWMGTNGNQWGANGKAVGKFKRYASLSWLMGIQWWITGKI